MLQPSRAQQVAQRLDSVLVELEHARGLAPGVELAPAFRILGGDAGGAMVGVAAQRLDAAEREHEAARGVAPVLAHRPGAGEFEGACELAGRADPDAVAPGDPDPG